jgi:hypothetical protein
MRKGEGALDGLVVRKGDEVHARPLGHAVGLPRAGCRTPAPRPPPPGPAPTSSTPSPTPWSGGGGPPAYGLPSRLSRSSILPSSRGLPHAVRELAIPSSSKPLTASTTQSNNFQNGP